MGGKAQRAHGYPQKSVIETQSDVFSLNEVMLDGPYPFRQNRSQQALIWRSQIFILQINVPSRIAILQYSLFTG